MALTSAQELLYAGACAGDIFAMSRAIQLDPKVIDKKDENGLTALHYAAIHGQLTASRFLTKKGARTRRDKHGRMPLHYAAQHGRDAIVDHLARLPNASVFVQDNAGYTPLHYAAEQGHEGAVRYLLPRLVNPEQLMLRRGGGVKWAMLRRNWPVIFSAASSLSGLPGYLEKLASTISSPLILAVENNHLGTVKMLLDNPNINPNQRDGSGRTALIVAAELGYLDAVKKLLDSNRVNVNAAVPKQEIGVLSIWVGGNALHGAIRNKHQEIALLLAALPNIDPNQKDVNGTDALHAAIEAGQADVAHKLITSGKIKDINQQTALGRRDDFSGFGQSAGLLVAPKKTRLQFAIDELFGTDQVVEVGNFGLPVRIIPRAPNKVQKSAEEYRKIINSLLGYANIDPNLKSGNAFSEERPLHTAICAFARPVPVEDGKTKQ